MLESVRDRDLRDIPVPSHFFIWEDEEEAVKGLKESPEYSATENNSLNTKAIKLEGAGLEKWLAVKAMGMNIQSLKEEKWKFTVQNETLNVSKGDEWSFNKYYNSKLISERDQAASRKHWGWVH